MSTKIVSGASQLPDLILALQHKNVITDRAHDTIARLVNAMVTKHRADLSPLHTRVLAQLIKQRICEDLVADPHNATRKGVIVRIWDLAREYVAPI